MPDKIPKELAERIKKCFLDITKGYEQSIAYEKSIAMELAEKHGLDFSKFSGKVKHYTGEYKPPEEDKND